MSAQDFFGKTPAFAPEAFFLGYTKSWGMIETISGNPDEAFYTESNGYRESAVALVLVQHFTFADGRTKDRHWRLVKIDDHHYEGVANDVSGIAHGEAYGNVFHLKYTLALMPGNPFENVTMDHWMYLQEDGSMVNRVAIRKLGITLARATEYFQHISNDPTVPEY